MAVEIADIAKLELRCGDVLVLRLPKEPTAQAIKRTNEQLRELMHRAGIRGVHAVCLGPGASFEIIRAEEAAR